MTQKLIARRKERRRKQKWRAVKQKRKETNRRSEKTQQKNDCSKKKTSASEHSILQRKLRPCCRGRYDMCTRKPFPGMRTKCLSILAERCVRTPLNTISDTTDVSVFQEVLGDLCRELPIAAVLTNAHIHVVSNQRHILEGMVQRKEL